MALNNTSDHANAAGACHASIDLRAHTCKSVRNYIDRLCETLTGLTIRGIVIGWRKPSITSTTSPERAWMGLWSSIYSTSLTKCYRLEWRHTTTTFARATFGPWTI